MAASPVAASPADVKLVEKPAGGPPMSPTAGEFDELMAKFSSVKEALAVLNRSAETIDSLRDQDEQVTDEDKRKAINQQLETVLAETHKHVASSKTKLDDIKKENEELAKKEEYKNGSRLEMRQNLYNATVRKFAAAMEKFNIAHQTFKDRAAARQRRRLKQLDNKLPDQVIERLIEEGNGQKVLEQAFISEDLQNAITEIEERHTRVAALERQIREVFELFKDLAVLVDIQQDSLDVIEKHIHAAKDYAAKGEDHLKQAEKHQETARKRQCCILIIVLVVLGVILGPTLATVLNKS